MSESWLAGAEGTHVARQLIAHIPPQLSHHPRLNLLGFRVHSILSVIKVSSQSLGVALVMERDDGITCELMFSKVMLQWLHATGVLNKTPTKKLLRGSECGVSLIISHSPGRQKGQPSRASVSEPFNI